MKKKYAFLLMGADFDITKDQVCFETEKLISCLYTVRNPEEAKTKVTELANKGYGAIELCGAFGSELADELITLTEGKISIGYVVHNPQQDNLFAKFFS